MLKTRSFTKLTQRLFLNSLNTYGFATLPKFATCDPFTLSEDKPYTLQNRGIYNILLTLTIDTAISGRKVERLFEYYGSSRSS